MIFLITVSTPKPPDSATYVGTFLLFTWFPLISLLVSNFLNFYTGPSHICHLWVNSSHQPFTTGGNWCCFQPSNFLLGSFQLYRRQELNSTPTPVWFIVIEPFLFSVIICNLRSFLYFILFLKSRMSQTRLETAPRKSGAILPLKPSFSNLFCGGKSSLERISALSLAWSLLH